MSNETTTRADTPARRKTLQRERNEGIRRTIRAFYRETEPDAREDLGRTLRELRDTAVAEMELEFTLAEKAGLFDEQAELAAQIVILKRADWE